MDPNTKSDQQETVDEKLSWLNCWEMVSSQKYHTWEKHLCKTIASSVSFVFPKRNIGTRWLNQAVWVL